MRRSTTLLPLFACLCLLAAPRLALAQPKPAAAPAAAPGARTADAVNADLEKAEEELGGIMSPPGAHLDPAKRKVMAPKALPVLKRMTDLLDEMARLRPDFRAEAALGKLDVLTTAAFMGDDAAAATLDKLAKAPAGGDVPPIDAQCAQAIVKFWNAAGDAAAQGKVLDDVQALARANPKADGIARALLRMSKEGPATPAVSDRALDILVADLTGPVATETAPIIRGRRKLRDAIGKPFELSGLTLDGKTLSTKNWQGKVVLVDFWATWCGPCVRALPRVKKVYAAYHDKGLEVLGISSDEEAGILRKFLDEDKQMPWPQLFDPKKKPDDLHPLATAYGIDQIPTMFLIDRKGVLRSADADADFEDQIPKLIDEK